MEKAKVSADAAAIGGGATSGYVYEVFLSFRGPDTRSRFTDFLYTSMIDAGIHVYRDDEELRAGEEFSGELLKAIKNSKIYIPIFSESYASSCWCLRGLVEMVESKVKSGGGKAILPIFYDVKPSDVKLETSLYRGALVKHEERIASKEAKAWADALREVGSLTGWEMGSSSSSHRIRELVEEIVAWLKGDWDNSATKKGKDSADAAAMGGDTTLGYDYEVFLSFRGPDTRREFTDFLYQGLADFGVHAFRDDEEIRADEEFGPELLQAIESSKICVPIFSKGYASGTWCLKELVAMVESKVKSGGGKAVMPIFYDVKPSDVKLETPLYRNALMKHEERIGSKEAKAWADALREVGSLSGWEMGSSSRSRFIRELARAIAAKLKVNRMDVDKYFVRTDQVEAITDFLAIDSGAVGVLGICGLGGIGKTALAKAAFNNLCCRFQGCSFLEDVRESSHRCDLVKLQKRLLSDILYPRVDYAIANTDEGRSMIMKKLSVKKVLIVLDDVDEMEQIRKLIGQYDGFGSGSRIIVTTRKRSVLKPENQIVAYEMEEMTSDQALLLFSRHAFQTDSPPDEYESLSRELVSITGGLPLAVECLGSYLRGRSADNWKCTMEHLKRQPLREVHDNLRLGYEALDYNSKQIFLDIACFFVNQRKDKAMYMWEACHFCPEFGVSVLIDMSLIKIIGGDTIWMHSELRDLGREIVRMESPWNLGRRSRLWFSQGSLDVLRSKEGEGIVEALSLAGNTEGLIFTHEEIARQPHLRFIELDGGYLEGNFENSFSMLLYLSWHRCPPDFKATNLFLRNLVVLDLSESDITDDWGGWSQIKMAKNLKVLDLTGCGNITRTPEFSGYLNLEKMILSRCVKLREIDFSIGKMTHLTYLSLEGCISLEGLPREIESLELLNELNLSNTRIMELPDSIGKLKKINVVTMERSKRKGLPLPMEMAEKLKELQGSQSMGKEEVWMEDEAKEPVACIGDSCRKSPHVAKEYLVGIEKKVEDMMDLLDLEVSDVRIVGIWGKSGVGKTRLAKVIYNQLCSQFNRCSFLADIAATTKQFGGVRLLQSKLMSDILKREYVIDHAAKGINFFKDVLRNMKVLIVLDDVEARWHLHDILGEKLDWVGYGSRIIVTTGIISVLPEFIPRGLAHVYGINMMNNDQALELLRKHALRRNLPIPDFDEIAKGIIKSVSGIPLLIEVIGSLLYRKVVEERTAIEELIFQYGLDIEDILMICCEELSIEHREIFLDIACLPADVDRRIASFMWDNPCGVDALHVRSLVKIGQNNELGMHGLLRECGQQIIRKEDRLDPGRRGRLCNLELALNTQNMEGDHLNFAAEDFKSMPNIRFLILDCATVDGNFANVFPNLKWLQWQGCTSDFKASNFHVEKLVILDLSWSKVTKDWGGWREIKMPQLKVLNLTGCADLLISPDLSSFPDLEILILERCSRLIKLDASIRHLKNLTSLNLRFCNNLNMLPIELGQLKALTELHIDGTLVQEIPMSVGYMERLEIFSASNCLQLSVLPDSVFRLTALSLLYLENAKITKISNSVGKLRKLRHLSLRECRWIGRLPDSICQWEGLEQLDISGTGISKLTDSITCLSCLKVLKMDSCFIRELPREIGNLANLEELHASHCRSLKGAIPTTIKRLERLRILRLGQSSISGLPSEIVSLSCLQTLDLLGCNKIQALPELPSNLTCLHVSSDRMKALPDLKNLVKLEEICLGDKDPKELMCPSPWVKTRSSSRYSLEVAIGLPKLKILELSHSRLINLQLRHGYLSCTHLKKLVLSGVNVQGLSELPSSLSVLSIERCLSLKQLPAVRHLRTLSELNLIESAVEEIEGLEGLIALEVLNISYCEIQNLNGLAQLTALRRLILSDCDSLDRLPNISNLKMLNVLEVQRCRMIHDIEGLMELPSLEVLHVSKCEAEHTQVQDALELVWHVQ